MEKQEEIKAYLEKNYSELFAENIKVDKSKKYYSLESIGIGFFYKVKKDFAKNEIQGLYGLYQQKDAIEIFYDYPVICSHWVNGRRAGRYNDATIYNSKKQETTFTSLFGIHYIMCDSAQKDDYGVFNIPLAKWSINDKCWYFGIFAYGEEIQIPVRNNYINSDDAFKLIKKMMNDKVMMGYFTEFLKNHGTIKPLTEKEMKNIKQAIELYNQDSCDNEEKSNSSFEF